MTHPVHPTVLARYMRLQRTHRSILPAGEQTAIRQLESLDPHGILSMAEMIGPERAAQVLRVRVEAMERSTEPKGVTE